MGHAQFCTMSPKCQNLFSGNKKPRFGDIPRAVASPKNAKPFFPEIRNPVLGTSIAPIRRHLVLFGAIFYHGLILLFYVFDIFRPYMISLIFDQMRRKIYLVTRVFAQKGNGVTVFGHFFCQFSQNFFDSCAMKNKNNKNKLQDLY